MRIDKIKIPSNTQFYQTYLLLLITMALGTPSIYPIQLPDIKTRSLFAQCIVKAIWNTIRNKKECDRDWEDIYQTNKYDMQNAEQSAQKLRKKIGQNITQTPSEFSFGLSSSAYQFEGGIDGECASSRFYKKQGCPTPNRACNFWHNYETMIKEMAEQTEIKIFRMEILWSRVQADGPDTFNYEAIQHYKKIVQTLKKYDIQPLIVFHHYTIPTWFEDRGGFEQEKNIAYFVNFCSEIYHALHQDVTFWSTFNAVEGYAFKGYWVGDGAPGIKGDMQKTALVIKNMLEAHVQVYQKIKENYQHYYRHLRKQSTDIPKPQIGIQKNILPLDPASNTWKQKLLSVFSRMVCEVGNLLQNEGFYNFFTNGTYRIYIPTKAFVVHSNLDAPKSLDWIGVNTYSNRYMYLGQEVIEQDPEKQTLNPNYRFCPQGIYRAVQEVAQRIAQPIAKLKNMNSIPIWITENGIPTRYSNKYDDKKRTRFFQQALHTITQIVADGYQVKAYIPWSSHDNYEWGAEEDFGTKPYGFFYVDPKNPNGPHPLKEGSRYFCNFVHAFYDKDVN